MSIPSDMNNSGKNICHKIWLAITSAILPNMNKHQLAITSANHSKTPVSEQNCRTLQHCDTYRCWKCLRLTFSSDLEEAMFDTGESLSPNKFKFSFWENLKVYMNIIVFCTKQLQNLSMVLMPSSLTPLEHQKLMHPLMSLILYLPHSLQDYYTGLVLFLIILVTLSGLWLRVSNKVPLACPSLQPL